ncbi:MAG: hypothetical protein ACI8TQ_000655 [Planctomycetota bacterium]|jgi:hypothetical protein
MLTLQLALLCLATPIYQPLIEGRVLFETPSGEIHEQRLADFEATTLNQLGAAWVRFTDARPQVATDPRNTVELELHTGDRLRGRVFNGDEEGIVLELAGGVRFPLPIDGIRSLIFPARLPADGTALLSSAGEGDRLYRLVGDNLDRIDGAVESFSASGVQFESVLGTRKFNWDEVGALFIEAFEDEAPSTTGKGESVVCDLVDGSRLRGQLLLLDRRGCLLQIAGEHELLLPIAVLSEISLDDGSVAFLSDLTASSIEEGSPFGDDLGMVWPHRMDRSVMGTALIAGGETYSRGIGVHAPSSLSFDLDEKWNQLRGLIAIDDAVLRLHARGSVIFRIKVDGEIAYASGVVRGGTPPIAFPPVDLTGAKLLTIECDVATDFAVADRANWLRMVLVRTEQ